MGTISKSVPQGWTPVPSSSGRSDGTWSQCKHRLLILILAQPIMERQRILFEQGGARGCGNLRPEQVILLEVGVFHFKEVWRVETWEG